MQPVVATTRDLDGGADRVGRPSRDVAAQERQVMPPAVIPMAAPSTTPPTIQSTKKVLAMTRMLASAKSLRCSASHAPWRMRSPSCTEAKPMKGTSGGIDRLAAP